MKTEKTECCQLCARVQSLHFHHLVPRKLHNKRVIQALHADKELIHYGIWVCADCHKMIHKKINHHGLATQYYTLDLLLKHPEIQKFTNWAKKQKKKIKR